MSITTLKVERRSARVSGAVKPATKSKLTAFCDDQGVNESTAINFILENFLSGNFGLPKELHHLTKFFSENQAGNLTVGVPHDGN